MPLATTDVSPFAPHNHRPAHYRTVFEPRHAQNIIGRRTNTY